MDEHKPNEHAQAREYDETGAGGEAAEGLHSAGGRPEKDTSGVEQANEDDGEDRPGSEPLEHRTDNPKGGYGGEGGVPRGDHAPAGARRAAEGGSPEDVSDAATR